MASKNKNSDRRGFFSKIAKLGVAGGISALLLGRLGEKTIISPVHAADMVIDVVNTGTATTYLDSSLSSGEAFKGTATATSGNTIGVTGLSLSTSGVGVAGFATKGIGVLGQTDSTADFAKAIHGVITSTSPGLYSAAVLGENKGTGNHGIGVSGMQNGSGYGVCGYTPSGFGVVGESDSGVGVLGNSLGANVVPIVAWGESGQTANLQEWRNSSGTALSVVNKDGWMGIGTPSPARQLHIQGNQAVSRMDRDVDSAAFIFVRTAPGDFGTVWKSFMFGADASAVNNGRFVIGDLGTATSGVSTKRLVIDNTGRVGIGTESPAELLHVAGNVRATGFITGDIVMANDYKVTEDEKDGVAFLNPQGDKIAVLDAEGNLRIKGKVIEGL